MSEIITTTGTVETDRIIVKASGWVKYQRNGEIHHLPPHRVKAIHERDPEPKREGSDILDSDVIHSSPHGRV